MSGNTSRGFRAIGIGLGYIVLLTVIHVALLGLRPDPMEPLAITETVIFTFIVPGPLVLWIAMRAQRQSRVVNARSEASMTIKRSNKRSIVIFLIVDLLVFGAWSGFLRLD